MLHHNCMRRGILLLVLACECYFWKDAMHRCATCTLRSAPVLLSRKVLLTRQGPRLTSNIKWVGEPDYCWHAACHFIDSVQDSPWDLPLPKTPTLGWCQSFSQDVRCQKISRPHAIPAAACVLDVSSSSIPSTSQYLDHISPVFLWVHSPSSKADDVRAQ